MTRLATTGPRAWLTELHRGLLDHRSVMLALSVIFPVMATAAMGALFSRVGAFETLPRIAWAAFIAIACALVVALTVRLAPRVPIGLTPARVTIAAFALGNSLWVFAMVETVTSFGSNPAALPPVLIQLVAITASGVVWQLLLTWQVHQQRLAHQAMVAEQSRLEELEQLVASEREVLDTYRRDLLAVVQRALAGDLAKVEDGVKRVLDGSSVDETHTHEAQQLARTARDVSRAITTQQADFTPTKELQAPADPSSQQVIRSWLIGVAGARIPVAWMLVAIVLLRIPVETPQPLIPFTIALLAPVLAVSSIVVATNTLLGRLSKRTRAAVGLLRFALIGIGAWWAIQTWVAPVSLVPGAVSWVGEPAGILPAAWITVAAVAIAAVLFARREYVRATESAQASVASTEQARLALQLKIDQAKDRLADVLHGRVQGSAHALTGALTIYRCNPGDPNAVATLESSAQALRTALDDVAATLDPEIPALIDRLDHLPREWKGVMDVDLHIDDATRAMFDDDPALASAAVTTCINLAVNAFRHGSSRSLVLTLTPAIGYLRIEAKDDGVGIPDPHGLVHGSGFTRILHSGGRIDFGETGEGSLITVLLPLTRRGAHGPDIRLSRI